MNHQAHKSIKVLKARCESDILSGRQGILKKKSVLPRDKPMEAKLEGDDELR